MIASRIALPVRDLARSTEFYRDRLGLPHTGGFRDHEGYDGDFFALPGGGELELTTGPTPPVGAPDEDLLLVLSVADRAALDQWTETLATHGVRPISAANPYWNRTGLTVLDPDGYRIVLAVRDGRRFAPPQIEWHHGDRAPLRASFELADDSAEQLAGYFDLGKVLVARRGTAVVGHLQLVPTSAGGEIEVRNMAVLPAHQGTGVGRALVDEAVRYATAAGYTRMLVATATADAGNIRFYQRVGFRMHSVEPDAFTPETGYPDPIIIDGIELRDRVWFTRPLSAAETS
jgi:GNAT superfamily N-acetyltransferase